MRSLGAQTGEESIAVEEGGNRGADNGTNPGDPLLGPVAASNLCHHWRNGPRRVHDGAARNDVQGDGHPRHGARGVPESSRVILDLCSVDVVRPKDLQAAGLGNLPASLIAGYRLNGRTAGRNILRRVAKSAFGRASRLTGACSPAELSRRGAEARDLHHQ